MPKLPRLPASAAIAALQRLGCEIVRQKGRHVVLRRQSLNPENGDASVTCVEPPHRRDLAVGTLGSVLRQAGIDPATFIDVL
ncbi:type II toxin-antitoxin system HicA family toxin [Cyanobium sp. ATX 6F1]|uniref:type II toxin-antitoxin system HicA family toxin n=1 Tax=unclassified Cyanobium TaxID=2627006 RepID=UPI0020CF992F|nr:type II toxin-antitoxin system HicA family toxin [Cyanobium sp. ATX 6F1]MCP9917555.1 type II toxin-antitoxin system HicA family toxin [Cyanobium sp. ATX 6F1]